MYMKDEKIVEIDDYRLELENRIRNLLWTISGDYTLNMKVDVSLYLRSKAIALYDGIKQGALAKYYDRNLLGLYLVKKVFCQAGEGELTAVAQLCVEEAIGDKICQERPGVREMQKEAFEDILDQEFERMPAYGDILGRLKIAILRDRLQNGNHYVEERLREIRDMVYKARTAADTIELIRIIDSLYNTIIDPNFEKDHGTLEQVMAVTLEELTEYDWEDFLTEELYEEALESYIEQMTNKITDMEDTAVTEEMEKQRQTKHKITILTEEELEKAYTYVELNFGKTYLTPAEEKRMNYLMCRELHRDCSLYFTEGILKNPVKRNYQYEYAVRLKNKNIWLYHDKHRIVKQNIASLTDLLRKTLVLKSETQEVLSDRGTIIPSRLWRVGRSSEANLFKRELKSDASDFVVDVLIDASGSQMSRQGDVALQAYIISEALSNVNLPHRVMSFCTFWDYTILHRFRDYDNTFLIYCCDKVFTFTAEKTLHAFHGAVVFLLWHFKDHDYAADICLNVQFLRTIINVNKKQVVKKQVLDKAVFVKAFFIRYDQILDLKSGELANHISIFIVAMGDQYIFQLIVITDFKILEPLYKLAVGL